MNSISIASYIAQLENENKELREVLDVLYNNYVKDNEDDEDSEDDEDYKEEEEDSDDDEEMEEEAKEDIEEEEEMEDSEEEEDSDEEMEEVKEEEIPVSTNEEIAWHLDILGNLEVDEHRKIAYKNAAVAIRKLDFEVTDGYELSTGDNKVPGIGKGIAAKIDEFIQTGEIKRIDELMN